MDAILGTGQTGPISSQPKDLVAEANHRIANSLTLLVSMIRLQAAGLKRQGGTLSSADVRLMLEGIAARISTIGQLHRLLSHTAADGVTDLKPHLKDVTDALVAALSSPDQAVRVTHGGTGCLVPVRHVQPIILILCEIFINAMKYAHPTGVPLQMTVECHPSDGRLLLAISDDGVGLPEGFDPTQGGLGFRVMRNLAAEIGAAFGIHSTGLGLSFTLSLPLVAQAMEQRA
jgi:two-component sensor histidine kinase